MRPMLRQTYNSYQPRSKPRSMIKKLPYTMLMIACISLFSFKQVCRGNDQTCSKNERPKKVFQAGSEKDWNLSPFYNFLKI